MAVCRLCYCGVGNLNSYLPATGFGCKSSDREHSCHDEVCNTSLSHVTDLIVVANEICSPRLSVNGYTQQSERGGRRVRLEGEWGWGRVGRTGMRGEW